jgi:multidrug resistance efflux pump
MHRYFSSISSSFVNLWKRRLRLFSEAVLKRLPIFFLISFPALTIWMLRDAWLPSRLVEAVLPLVMEAPASERAQEPVLPEAPVQEAVSRVLFQASGWIEADPYPHRAVALEGGVVESVPVLEGERVEKGQVLATMVRDDLEIERGMAAARLEQEQAQWEASMSRWKASVAEEDLLDLDLAVQRARIAEVEDRTSRLMVLPEGTVSQEEVEQSRLRLKTVQSELARMEGSRLLLQANTDALRLQAVALEGRVAEARLALARKELSLRRSTVLAPMSGRVQKLLVGPGSQRMPASDAMDSLTIAWLYEPDHLQARIDVPLEDAAKVAIGQPVRLRSNLLPDQSWDGVVSRVTGEADLQRNTLQVKVRLLDPSSELCPEMLCRAEFLAVDRDVSSESGGTLALSAASGISLYLPVSAVDGSAAKPRIWTLDAERRRAISREVVVAEASDPAFVRVLSGLRPGDPVLLHDPAGGLKEGQRVRLQTH